jgi:hypothetical protein
MEFVIQNKVKSDFDGYNSLINLSYAISQNIDAEIILDFKNCIKFEANLSAILGAICSISEEQKKTINFINLNTGIQKVLQKNKFLCAYGWDAVHDANNTIITFQKFTPYADIEFMDYIRDELLSKPDFPKLSRLLGKKINESIFEIFENARTHGLCKYIHTCGQYFSSESIKRLDMTIVDMGQTIKTNVNDYLHTTFSASEAIEWALAYGNTTKIGNIPGGLGLDIIFEFIKLNKGKIQIVSSDGYWEYRNGKTENKLFDKPFSGTIVNIEFNLDDKDSYRLTEEVSLEDIF